MRKSGVFAVAAAMIGGAVVLFAPAPAAATVVSGSAAAATLETALAQEVRHTRGHRSKRHRSSRHRSSRYRHSRRYDRRRHGSRYSHRRPGFTFHYGGYYYANPWWVGPSVGYGVTVPLYPAAPSVNAHSAHVQWCINRYRSYDPRTDTYVPRIGVRAHCNSPYR